MGLSDNSQRLMAAGQSSPSLVSRACAFFAVAAGSHLLPPGPATLSARYSGALIHLASSWTKTTGSVSRGRVAISKRHV